MSKKSFNIGISGSINSTDPTQGGNIYSSIIILAVYDTLYEFQFFNSQKIKPRLASALPTKSPDGLTYTIPIKKGIYFKNDPCFAKNQGREITAHDFVYSMSRHFNPSYRSTGHWLWRGIFKEKAPKKSTKQKKQKKTKQSSFGISAIDRYTIRIVLNKPFPQLIHTLTTSYSAIIAKEAEEYYGKNFATKPVGSGPFFLKQINNKHLILEKNNNYRNEFFSLSAEGFDSQEHGFTQMQQLEGLKLPILEQVKIHFILTPLAKWLSLNKKDEVDSIELPRDLYSKVLSKRPPWELKKPFNEKLRSVIIQNNSIIYSEFNMKSKDFGYRLDPQKNLQNKRLRCAITKTIDWKRKRNRYYHGIAKIFSGIIPPGIKGFNSKSKYYFDRNRDRSTAIQLIKKNKWKTKEFPQLIYPSLSSIQSKLEFENFRESLVEIGYPKEKIKIHEYSNYTSFYKSIKDGKHNFHSWQAWFLDYPDAHSSLSLYYGPNHSPGINHSGYNNKEYNLLFKKTLISPEKERILLYKTMNQILLSDCVVIAGMSIPSVYLWKKNILMYPAINGLQTFRHIGLSQQSLMKKIASQ